MEGRVSFAEPCRPSIHSTWRMAKSGTSDQGTPAEVTSLTTLATPSALRFDIKTIARFRKPSLPSRVRDTASCLRL